MNWVLITTTFLTINLDFLIILLFLCQKFKTHQVLVGYLIGLYILVIAAFLSDQLLRQWLPEWNLGILGLIPIWAALHDDDDQHQQVVQHNPIITVTITYLSVCAGCNLSLFLPVLANQTWTNLVMIIGYLTVLTSLLVYCIAFCGNSAIIQRIMKRWEEPLMKICYIGIGIYVLIDSGLVHHLITLI